MPISPIHIACKEGHERSVFEYIKSGIDINDVDDHHRTCLHVASQYGKIEIVKILLKKKCDINLLNDIRQTSLHIACIYGHNDIVELLLQNNADVNIIDSYGCTPLCYACNKNRNANIVQSLIHQGADFNTLPYDRKWNPLSSMRGKHIVDNIHFHLKGRTHVNTKNIVGRTPLLYSCLMGAARIVDVLIKNGCDVNVKTPSGISALQVACLGYSDSSDKERIVKLLISSMADVNNVDNRGDTPLHYACSGGLQGNNEHIVKLLLKAHADVFLINNNGKTPLHNACDTCNHNNIKNLLKYGSEINATDKRNETPLHRFCRACQSSEYYRKGIDTMELLLEKNADINVLNKEHKTPFEFIRGNVGRQYFLRHVIKLKTSGFYVRKEYLNIVKIMLIISQDYHEMKSEYFEEICKNEILLLKHKIVQRNISLFDILKENEQQIAKWMRYKQFSYNFERILSEENYPVYGNTLRWKVIKGMHSVILMKSAENILRKIIGATIIDELIPQIVNNLSEKDLQFLITAYEREIVN